MLPCQGLIQHQICNTALSGSTYIGIKPLLCTRLFSLMSDRRRLEIESKRAKLAELRKARADRQRADVEKRTSDVRTLYFIRTDSHILIDIAVG